MTFEYAVPVLAALAGIGVGVACIAGLVAALIWLWESVR